MFPRMIGFPLPFNYEFISLLEYSFFFSVFFCFPLSLLGEGGKIGRVLYIYIYIYIYIYSYQMLV